MELNYRLKRWLRFVAILVIVLILCWQNSASSEKLTNAASRSISSFMNFFGGSTVASSIYYAVRKCGHFLVFALLGLFGHLAIAGNADDTKSAIACSTITCFIIAIIAEITQAYALDRHATFRDALINLGGSSFGIILGLIVEAIKRRTKH